MAGRENRTGQNRSLLKVSTAMKNYNYLNFFHILMYLVSFPYVIPAQVGQSSFPAEANPVFSNPVPPSPSVASLGKFIDMPISHYAGIPEIMVPLFSVKEGIISVPIALRFHASGLKVEDIPGWVGAGWSLEAGGTISRIVRGLPDEETYGFFNTCKLIPEDDPDDVADYQLLKNLADGIFDGEPDLYYFNFNGNTGKFFIHPELGAVTIPYRKIEITPSYDQYGLAGFRIRTADGMQYYFGQYNSANPESFGDGIEYTRVQLKGPDPQEYRTAWHLMEIISPDGKDRITFRYEGYYLSYDVRFSETEYLTSDQFYPCAIPDKKRNIIKSQVVHDPAKKIREIIFTHASLEFFSSDGRKDLYTGQKLDSVLLKSKDGTILRRWFLSYDYFEADVHTSENQMYNFRLRLDSVWESGTDRKKPPYRFLYDNDGVPARDSNGQDHWGYFNGKNLHVSTTLPQIDSYEGADREPDGKYMLAGSLKRLYYPTGGYTDFQFEPNEIRYTDYIYSSLHTLLVHAMADGSLSWIRDSVIFTNTGQNQVATIKVKINFEADMAPHEPYVVIEDLTSGDLTMCNHTMWEEPYQYNIIHGHTYKLSACVQGDQMVEASAALTWEKPLETPVVREEVKTIGGLRIKELRYYDNINPEPALIRSYTYDEARVLSYPQYTYYQTIWKDDNQPEGQDPIPCSQKACEYLVRTSVNKSLLGSGGYPVVYPVVSELLGSEGRGGKTEYVFSFEMDEGMNGFPFPPPTSNDWQRGLLIEKTDYKYDEVLDKYVYVRKTVHGYNNYKSDTANSVTLSGLKVGYNFAGKTCIDDSIRDLLGSFAKVRYYLRSRWVYEKSVTEFERGNYDTAHVTIGNEKYYYDNPEHAQPTRIITYTDSLTDHGIQILYPMDFGEPYEPLIGQHLIALPVEIRKYMIDKLKNDTLLLELQRSDYHVNGPHTGKLSAQYELDMDNPGKFNPGLLTGYPVSELRKISSYHYDLINKNLVRIHRYDAPVKSILWDYDQRYPVAEITNALPGKVAYTSFEDSTDNQGNWFFQRNQVDNAYTGLKSHLLMDNSAITSSIDTIRNYILEFVFSGDDDQINVLLEDLALQPVSSEEFHPGWRHFEYRINSGDLPGKVSISGSGHIDELRLYPADAQMTTYTYRINVGVISITDNNFRSIFYEYDDLGRLAIIRNHKKEILEEYEYFYYADIE